MTIPYAPRLWHAACSIECASNEPIPQVAQMSEQSKVLIVDDDDVVRLSYQRSLQTAHYSVEAVANG